MTSISDSEHVVHPKKYRQQKEISSSSFLLAVGNSDGLKLYEALLPQVQYKNNFQPLIFFREIISIYLYRYIF